MRSSRRFCARLIMLALMLPAINAAAFGVEPPPPAMSYLPLIVVAQQSARSDVLISAFYYDTYLTNEPDEAIQLWNLGVSLRSLLGWRVSDGSRTATLPDLRLAPVHQSVRPSASVRVGGRQRPRDAERYGRRIAPGQSGRGRLPLSARWQPR